MANEVKPKKNKNDVVYFTQKELAERWRVTQATIKEIRERRQIPCFSPPGSSRILYPVDGIIQIEQDQTNQNYKEGKSRKRQPETMVKKPVNPAKSNKEWRI